MKSRHFVAYSLLAIALIILGLVGCSTVEPKPLESKQLEPNPQAKQKDLPHITPKTEDAGEYFGRKIQTVDLMPQATEYWQPTVGEAWHYQIGWPISQSDTFDDDIKIYSIDVFDNEPENITFLKNKGIKVICYVNVGAWEVWRDDAGEFPDSVILGNYDNWDGERWLDIRPPEKLDNPADGYKLREIMEARFTEAAARGCDAIEPDNLDIWNPFININNGQPREFEISYQDQLDYNIYIAQIAHDRGLSVGLKSDVEQAADLVDYYDWALNESCTRTPYPGSSSLSECQFYQDTFIAQNKAVFWIEYVEFGGTVEDFCPPANDTYGLSFMLSDLLLKGDVTTAQRCPEGTTPPPPPPPTDDNLLTNGDFTNDLDAWANGSCGNGVASVNAQNELSLAGGEVCIEQVVAVSELTSYTFSCSAKNINSGYSELGMFFGDSSGALLTYESAAVDNSVFDTNTVTVIAPAGSTNVLVSLYTYDGDMILDSCSLTVDDGLPPPPPPPPPPPTAENILTNGGFESDLTAWTACGGNKSSIISSTVEGNNALNIQGTTCLFQEAVAEPDSTYTFSCQAKRDLATAWSSMQLSFTTSTFASTGVSQVEEITGSDYNPISISLTAPANAANVAVTLYTEDEASLDDCRLTTDAISPPVGNVAPTITTIAAQSSVQGTSVSVPVLAQDADDDTLSFSATGLPAGVSISPATGIMSGSPTSVGTNNVTVTVSDGTVSVSSSFSWTITDDTTPPPPPSVTNLLTNPDFESGLTAWDLTGCGAGDISSSTDASNGSTAMELSKATVCIGQSISAIGGSTYTLSCDVKNVDSGYSDMNLYADGTEIAVTEIKSGSYTNRTISGVAPAGTEKLYVYFYHEDAGSIFVDNCVLSN